MMKCPVCHGKIDINRDETVIVWCRVIPNFYTNSAYSYVARTIYMSFPIYLKKSYLVPHTLRGSIIIFLHP